MSNDDYEKDFKTAFEYHWYQKKTLSQKLVDGMDWEKECCARFFEALNDLGMLDKCYPKERKGVTRR